MRFPLFLIPFDMMSSRVSFHTMLHLQSFSEGLFDTRGLIDPRGDDDAPRRAASAAAPLVVRLAGERRSERASALSSMEQQVRQFGADSCPTRIKGKQCEAYPILFGFRPVSVCRVT